MIIKITLLLFFCLLLRKRIKKLIQKIRKKILPTKKELALKSYWKDGGDLALRYSFKLNEDSIVLDLGGYKGEWSGEIYSRYKCSIHVFEPVESFYKNITYLFSKNDFVNVHKFGLGSRNRSELITLQSDSSSIFKKEKNVGEKIKINDVYEWFKINSIKRIDLIKINIEGGEYELLERMIETGLIPKVDTFQIQFHDFIPEAKQRMEKIREILELTHTPIYHYYFVWDCWKIKPCVN